MEKIEEISRELGFELVGAAPLQAPEDLSRFDDWLAHGRQGDMGYLQKNRDRIAEPQKLSPQSKSILCLGLSHARKPQSLEGGGKVARYAMGRDYHNLIGRMLERLKKSLAKAGIVKNSRSIVDAGPLLERSHAAEAGLGFKSKSANLLHKKYGPWFFLSELISDAELPTTKPDFLGSCGTCRACIDACPTGAIIEPFVVDSRLCISYLTIEHRSAIPRELRPQLGDWLFGCDVCSEVCPFGQKAPDTSSRYGTHASLEKFRLVDLLEIPESQFSKSFEASPLKRPKRNGLVRNALIVIGNIKNLDALPVVRKKLSDSSAMIRGQAAWTLGKLKDKSTLEKARKTENDSQVQLEIETALEEN